MGSSFSPYRQNVYPSESVSSSYTHSHQNNDSLDPLTKNCLSPNIRLHFYTALIQNTRLYHKKWVSSNITMWNATYNKSLVPITLLTKVEGEPTYNYINEYNFKLKTNARSVHIDLLGGGNDLLGIVMHITLYLILTDSEFNRPQHPW